MAKRKLTKAEQERYTAYLIEFRKLTFVQFCDMRDGVYDLPEAERDRLWNDEAWVRASSAFERHMKGGRGATPKALQYDYWKSRYVIAG